MTFFLLSFFLLFGDIEKQDPLVLSQVVYSESDMRVDYIFKSKKIEAKHSIQIQEKTGNTLLTFTENKKTVLKLRVINNKQVQIERDRKWETISPERQYLTKKQKISFDCLTNGVRSVSPNASRMGSGKDTRPGGSIPVIEEAMGSHNPDQNSNCSQTGTCSCGSSSVSITCSCGAVMACEERSVEVCDYREDGTTYNCRMVTSCVGFCV